MIILMIDCETTSLNPHVGVAHQLGFYAVNPNTNESILAEVIHLPTMPSDWDKSTLDWARKQPALVNNSLPDHGLDRDTVTEQRLLREDTARELVVWLKNYSARSGLPVAVVAAHPEFDLPFYERSGIDLRKEFGHSNVYDLKSMLLAHYAASYPEHGTKKMIDAAYSRTKGDHTALGDCIAQMKRLKGAGWGGLPAYYSNHPAKKKPAFAVVPTRPATKTERETPEGLEH